MILDKIWATQLPWEGGFTTPKMDGHYTLFGVTAAGLTGHSQEVLGKKASSAEIIGYMEWLASGIKGTSIKPDTDNVKCALIEDFRLKQARDFFVQTYLKDLALDKISQPDLMLMLAHVSFNGDHGALWVAAKMTAELRGEFFIDPMPQTFRNSDVARAIKSKKGKKGDKANTPQKDPAKSPYYRPPASNVEARAEHKKFAESIVARLNTTIASHPQAKDPGFNKYLKSKLYDVVRLYYANLLDHLPKRNKKFLIGWLNRYRALNDVSLANVKVVQPQTCDRPIERPHPQPVPAAETKCHYPSYTIHFSNSGLIPQAINKPAETIPLNDKAACEHTGGTFLQKASDKKPEQKKPEPAEKKPDASASPASPPSAAPETKPPVSRADEKKSGADEESLFKKSCRLLGDSTAIRGAEKNPRKLDLVTQDGKPVIVTRGKLQGVVVKGAISGKLYVVPPAEKPFRHLGPKIKNAHRHTCQ